MKMRPITNRVWVKPNVKKSKQDSGLFLPEAYIPGPKGMGGVVGQGVIYAIGPDVTEVKVGQHIFFSDFDGMAVDYDDQSFLVMKEEDVMAVGK